MNPRLLKFVQDVSASYWFIPTCMMALSAVLAVVCAWAERASAFSATSQIVWLQSLAADDARAILTLIAGSIIGIAGVSFSITIVAVSFATSNFGPRLISNFMTDRGNQVALGSFIGVFVFCLMTLASLHGSSVDVQPTGASAFVPRLSVGLSLIMALACMGVLIYFIHHVADSINIEEILADIGRNLEGKIENLYPDTELLDEQPLEHEFEDICQRRQFRQLPSCESGYVQTLDIPKMLEAAIEHDLLIDIHVRPGDFVSHQTILLDAWHSKEIDETDLRCLQECFAMGDQRTIHQNVLFLAEQLSEVIGRALSSGINDPYTAITCINWLRNALIIYLQGADSRNGRDISKRHRLRVRYTTFEQILAVMFDDCEQHVSCDEKVTLHCMAVLVECASHAKSEQYRQLIVSRFESLYHRAMENSDQQASLTIERRYREGMAILTVQISEQDARRKYRWFTGSN